MNLYKTTAGFVLDELRDDGVSLSEMSHDLPSYTRKFQYLYPNCIDKVQHETTGNQIVLLVNNPHWSFM